MIKIKFIGIAICLVLSVYVNIANSDTIYGISGSSNGITGVRGYDISTGLLVNQFNTNFDEHTTFTFSSDGYLYGLNGSSVLAYDVSTGSKVHEFYAGSFLRRSSDPEDFTSLHFGSDGYLYGLNGNKDIIAYDVTTGSEIKSINADFSGGIFHTALGSDTIYGTSGSSNGITGVRGYDIFTGSLVNQFNTNFSDNTTLTFGPDGYLYGLNGNYVAAYDVTSGLKVNEFYAGSFLRRPSNPVDSTSLAFGSDGYLYGLNSNRDIIAYDVSTGSEVKSINADFSGTIFHTALEQTVVPEPISSILFLTGGSLLAGRRYLKRKRLHNECVQ